MEIHGFKVDDPRGPRGGFQINLNNKWVCVPVLT